MKTTCVLCTHVNLKYSLVFWIQNNYLLKLKYNDKIMPIKVYHEKINKALFVATKKKHINLFLWHVLILFLLRFGYTVKKLNAL